MDNWEARHSGSPNNHLHRRRLFEFSNQLSNDQRIKTKFSQTVESFSIFRLKDEMVHTSHGKHSQEIDDLVFQYINFLLVYISTIVTHNRRLSLKAPPPYLISGIVRIDYEEGRVQIVLFVDDGIFGQVVGRKAANFNDLIRVSEPIKAKWPFVGDLRFHPYGKRHERGG